MTCILNSTIFGQSKEDITLVYKHYIRPILTYTHPAWQPDTRRTHINKLQITHNRALRIANSCTQTTPIPHLHRETLVLPLKQHMLMRETHINRLLNTHPKHLRGDPAFRQRARPPHSTVAKLYQTEIDSLLLMPDNTSLRTALGKFRRRKFRREKFRHRKFRH